MRRIIRYIEVLSVFAGKCIAVSIPLVVCIVVIEIVMRYIFDRPTVWASEAMVFLCAFSYTIGSAWVLKEKKHVRIDFLYSRLSERKRAVLDSLTFLAFALYMTMLLWASWKYAYKSVAIGETTGSAWDPAVWPVKLSLCIGTLLLLLQGTAHFFENICLALTGKKLKE